MSSTDAIQVGSVVSGTYRVTKLIAEGGFGSVWRADHLRLPGKRVAIKVLQRDVADDEETLLRFRREAEIASRLGHPNIVEVHDFNVLEDGSPYLVLEYLQGESLRHVVARGPMDFKRTCRILRQVGSALRAAHKNNIVHRDLKPDNIYLCSDGPNGEEYAKVLDFGISKIRGSKTLKTMDSALLGTPQYMAPEQIAGKASDIDGRADIFALGIIVYEMLSGRMAFEGDSIPSVMYKVNFEEPTPIVELLPSISAASAEALKKAINKDKNARFESVAEFVEAFTGEPLPRESQVYASAVTAEEDYESFSRANGQAVTRPPKDAEHRVKVGGHTQRRMWMIAGAFGVTALAGIVIALLWSGPPELPKPTSAEVSDFKQAQRKDEPKEVSHNSPLDSDAVGANERNAGAGTLDTPNDQAKPPKNKQPPFRAGAIEKPVAYSSELKAALDDAYGTLDHGDYGASIHAAKKIIINFKQDPNYKNAVVEAYGVQAQANCAKQDLGAAQAALVRTRGAVTKKACAFCAKKLGTPPQQCLP